jgi:hypothetical protein
MQSLRLPDLLYTPGPVARNPGAKDPMGLSHAERGRFAGKSEQFILAVFIGFGAFARASRHAM